MAYREVTMVQVKEVLRRVLAGEPKKRVARQLGLSPKTVRRYCELAGRHGIDSADALTDERMVAVMSELTAMPGRPHGESWQQCVDQRAVVEGYLRAGVRLSKIRKLLHRHGVTIPYPTLHRFAVEELGFGRTAATVPVDDGEPGHELQVDTGWLQLIVPDAKGRRRRLRVWIFTPSVSRYRFVYPCFEESTASLIEACESAWNFYGGVFRVLIPDNTKAVVHIADPLGAKIVDGFLEYAQARGFVVDPTRPRRPTDKARVERSVRIVRDDCFAGEVINSVDQAHARSLVWCTDEYGMRRHSRTMRMPREHFETVEKPALLPAPTEPYDVPQWSDPKVARDHFAQVQRALYSLPTKYIGKTLRARADRHTVRFYDGGVLVKTHTRRHPGSRSTDPSDFPEHIGHTARRDVAWITARARKLGAHVGAMAAVLLDAELPWTRFRRVYALMGLAKKYGEARLDEVCALALAAGMDDVRRLERMLAVGASKPETREGRTLPPGRFLRPANDWALQRNPETGETT